MFCPSWYKIATFLRSASLRPQRAPFSLFNSLFSSLAHSPRDARIEKRAANGAAFSTIPSFVPVQELHNISFNTPTKGSLSSCSFIAEPACFRSKRPHNGKIFKRMRCFHFTNASSKAVDTRPIVGTMINAFATAPI